MSKIYVSDGVDPIIDTIAWTNRDGVEEFIEPGLCETIALNLTGDSENYIYKEDVPKLIKALQKAIELGWTKE